MASAAGEDVVEENDPYADVEDPRRFEAMGEDALAAGKTDEARELFERMLDRHEIKLYLGYRANLREALVLERLGEHAAAAEIYKQSYSDDVARVIQVLRIMSVHPDRDALVEGAYAWVEGEVAKAKAGEKGLIYTTSKGAPRYLEVLTTDEVLKRLNAGKKVKYCYIEDFDLSDVASEDLPPKIGLTRCVLGRIMIPNKEVGVLTLRALVLGDADLGKTFEGERNQTKSTPASTFKDLYLREAIFRGRANFAGVKVYNTGRAYFPLVVFEGKADFKGAEFFGISEFRFSSFGAGANFKGLRMHDAVYFGGTRYRKNTVFTSVYSERDVYFNSVTFEQNVVFDSCEFRRGATFEDSRFGGSASMATTTVVGTLNLSRTVFSDTFNLKEAHIGSLDALGAWFRGPAFFMDTKINNRARFSLDEVTRHSVAEDIDGLLALYRRYQGDEDADEPLSSTSSYGVQSLNDLNARIDNDISFANTVFGGYTVFEGVRFGLEGGGHMASFFNSQFRGETHFEHTQWNALADFTTIFGNEVAFNNATFKRGLILDDANITGRLTLADAGFSPDANLSFYGAGMASFQVWPEQIYREDGSHTLFYESCAAGVIDYDDIRIDRITRGTERDEASIRKLCYDYTIDEFVSLKDSFGGRAMTADEDEAYWWTRHMQAMVDFKFGSVFTKVRTVIVSFLIFELCFGWGVRLGNLGIAVLLVTVVFAALYRVFCPDTILMYDGEDLPIREVSFFGLCFVSLQSLIAINTGWDFGDDDHRFRWLNTIETVIGFIILTFFVGAYTRMILA